MGAVVGVLVISFVISGLIGAAIGSGRGRGGAGFFLGLVFGFLGWIIAALLPASSEHEATRAIAIAQAMNAASGDGSADLRTCPWCAEHIKSAAVVCRYCGRDVEPRQDARALVTAAAGPTGGAASTARAGYPSNHDYASGWYQDPYGDPLYRYWDGSVWTDHTSPR